jgi:hypothetical protein
MDGVGDVEGVRNQLKIINFLKCHSKGYPIEQGTRTDWNRTKE